jgi:hypothetical protein
MKAEGVEGISECKMESKTPEQVLLYVVVVFMALQPIVVVLSQPGSGL